MSICPQQLYINEKYLDHSASINNSFRHNKQKNENKTASNITKHERSYNKESSQSYGPKWQNTNNEAVRQYMKNHRKSINDYYSLQRNQAEIVKLCRRRIAEHFSSTVLQDLTDEDIVRALKITQERRSSTKHMENSMDQFIDTIIEAIISIELSKYKIQDQRIGDGNKSHELIDCCSSYDEYNNSKHKSPSIISKLVCAFRKRNLPKYYQYKDYIKPKRYYNSDIKDSRYSNDADTTYGYPGNKNREIMRASTSQECSKSNSTIEKTNSNKCMDSSCSCSKRLKKIEADLKSQESKIMEIKHNLDEYFLAMKQLDHREEILKSIKYTNSNFGFKKKYIHAFPVHNNSGIINCLCDDKTECRLRAGTHVEDSYILEPEGHNYPTDKPASNDADYNSERKICCFRCKRKKPKVKKGTGKKSHGAQTKQIRHSQEQWEEPVPQVKSDSQENHAEQDIPTHSDTNTSEPPSAIRVKRDCSGKCSCQQQPHRPKQRKSMAERCRKKSKEEKDLEKKHRKTDSKATKIRKSHGSKEASKQAKIDTKHAKKQRKKTQKETNAKRPCCIRLIKWLCCSGCCV